MDVSHRWSAAFKECLDFDAWGQVAAATEAQEDRLCLPSRAAVGQLAAVLRLRIQELTAPRLGQLPRGTSVGLQGMQGLTAFVAGLGDVQLPAPVALALKAAGSSTQHASLAHLDCDEPFTKAMQQQSSTKLSAGEHGRRQPDASSAGPAAGTLRPQLAAVAPGDVTLSICFGSWSVKGAALLAQPHVLLTVRDTAGKLLEAVQQSPHVAAARSGDPDKLDLDFTWHLQTPLTCLPEGAAVFCELRHWKAAKKRWSVKCFACLAHSECSRQGVAMLELHKKPADYKCRGQRAAFTRKPMFLHVARALTQH